MSADNEQWIGPLPAAPGCDCHICRPDEDYDAQDRRVIDTVLEHGWQVIMVADDIGCDRPDHHDWEGPEDPDPMPAFAYTIGLGHRTGHPELLMSGLDTGLMHHSLNAVARRIMGGLRLRPGDALEDVLAGVPVAVEEASDAALRETVTWSGWFHRRKPDALAIVWPDRNGVFAWQPGPPTYSMRSSRADGVSPSGTRAVWRSIRPGTSRSCRTTECSLARTSSTAAEPSCGRPGNRMGSAARTGAFTAARPATSPTTYDWCT